MEIEFDLNKSVDENAGTYFNKAKKAKAKLEGAKKALKDSEAKLAKLMTEEDKFVEEEQEKEAKRNRKREWYEKFHWFISSEGFLCIGGRDASSNEIVVKKHTDKNDLVFHTDISGSPFFVIKDGQNAGEITRAEAAQATAVYSRAWKLGHGTAEVFYVNPEQVSKDAQPGEFLAKGSFMIKGKTNYLKPKLEYAIALVNNEIIGGPVEAIKSHSKKFVLIISGRNKKSALAKKIKAKLGGGDLDDIIKFIPSGGAEIGKGK